jgi:hypothetical protein
MTLKPADLARIGADQAITNYVQIEKGAKENPLTTIRVAGRARSRDIGRAHADAEGILRTYSAQPMTLDEMLARFVYLADGGLVCDLKMPSLAMTIANFRELTRTSVEWRRTTEMDGARKRTEQSTRLVIADAWRDSEDRKIAVSRTFNPAQGAIALNPSGQDCVNLWRGHLHYVPPTDWQERVRPFIEHIHYLVPIEPEREWFLDWMAHIVQAPGVLPHTHVLMIAEEVEGIGRNWVAGVLARVLRGYAALSVPLIDVMESGFNDELANKLLAVVDELHEGGSNQWKYAQKLKTELTREQRIVNPKYGRKYVEFNCCRFLMFSNHVAALPLSESDRRLVVIANPTSPMSPTYYAKLYHLHDDETFISSVRHWLAQRNIVRFLPGNRPLLTKMRDAVIDASTDDAARELRELVKTHDGDLILARKLKYQIDLANSDDETILTRDVERPSSPVAPHIYRRLLAAAGVRRHRNKVRIIPGGPQEKVAILRNAPRWMDATTDELRAELLRSREPH